MVHVPTILRGLYDAHILPKVSGFLVIIKFRYITICVGRVWIVIRYFFFEKHAFNGLFKVICI